MNVIARRRQEFGAGATEATKVALSVALVIVLAAAGPAVAAQDDVRDLEWEDLMPEGWTRSPGSMPRRAMTHRISPTTALGPSSCSTPIRKRFARRQWSASSTARRVRLPGFMVPTDSEGTETSEFLLVPYFGTCIHVPPPPSNPIVYVKTGAGYPMKELFDRCG